MYLSISNIKSTIRKTPLETEHICEDDTCQIDNEHGIKIDKKLAKH